MQYASQNLIPVTLELGGKSPNIFFKSVMDADDDFFDKCLEGATLFALNQARFAPARRAFSFRNRSPINFIPRFVERTKQIKMGHPLDPTTMMGAQASHDQYEKIPQLSADRQGRGCRGALRRRGVQKSRSRGRLLHRADHYEGP
jgi:aldehyde dehydrogenase